MTQTEIKKLIKRCRVTSKPRPIKSKGPNATEAAFRSTMLSSKAVYQPCRYSISATTRRRYTPDWRDIYRGREVIVETKGSYHYPSEQRSRLAWEIACEQNPGPLFVWARKVVRLMFSHWEIEVWADGGRTRVAAPVITKREFFRLLDNAIDQGKKNG